MRSSHILIAMTSSLVLASCAKPKPSTDGAVAPDGDGASAIATATASLEPTGEPTTTSAPTAEPVACTKKGCMSTLTLETKLSAPKPGKYDVEVVAGDHKGHCEITFPYPKCDTPATRCEGTLPIMANEEGCDLPPAQQVLPKLVIGETPKSAAVKVTFAKKTIIEKKIDPTYREQRPNGPNCDPVCQTGEATVSQ
jgi:hypothetical protein